MPIDKYGFLGVEIEKYRQHISQEFRSQTEYIKKFNQFLNELKFKLTPRDDDARGILIATLFVKALETYQSVYILTSYGLTADAEILNRVLFETVATLLYVSKSEENLKRYLAKDLFHKLKLIEIVRKDPEKYQNHRTTQQRLSEAEDTHRLELKELGNPKPITVEGMIKETEVANLYDPFYRSTSGPVHSNPHSMERYVLDRDGKVTVVWGPRDKEINILLSSSVEFMLICCKRLSEVFGQPKDGEIVEFNNEKDRIWLKDK